jgi:hypothetical protein
MHDFERFLVGLYFIFAFASDGIGIAISMGAAQRGCLSGGGRTIKLKVR